MNFNEFKRFLILFLFLFTLYSSFPILIYNLNDLKTRQLNKELFLSINFTSLSFINLFLLNSQNITLNILLNNSLCYSYHNKLYDIQVILPYYCLPFQSFWFSVSIQIDIPQNTFLNSNSNSNSNINTINNNIDNNNMITKYAISLPIYIPSYSSLIQNNIQDKIQEDSITTIQNNKLTLVLTLTFDDVSRGYLLLLSLQTLSSTLIYEMFIITPEIDLIHIKTLLSSSFRKSFSFPIHIISESIILPSLSKSSDSSTHFYPYAIQMALKILISQHISTSYYLTLDSDILLVNSFSQQTIFRLNSSLNNFTQSIFEYEPRNLHHPFWWDGSENFLEIPFDYFTPSKRLSQGFSVTPAILSTYGSLLVLNRIYELFLQKHSLSEVLNDKSIFLQPRVSWNPSLSKFEFLSLSQSLLFNQSIIHWIGSLGKNNVIWSEYTLYRLVLDYYHVRFPNLIIYCLLFYNHNIYQYLF